MHCTHIRCYCIGGSCRFGCCSSVLLQLPIVGWSCGSSLWDGKEWRCNRQEPEILRAGIQWMGASTFCVGLTGSRVRIEPFEVERNIVCWKVFPTISCHEFRMGNEKERSSSLLDVCGETICCWQCVIRLLHVDFSVLAKKQFDVCCLLVHIS